MTREEASKVLGVGASEVQELCWRGILRFANDKDRCVVDDKSVEELKELLSNWKAKGPSNNNIRD